MGYYLNPTELTAMFAVPASVSEKHLKIATADQLRVLLWCLKNADKQYDIAAICESFKLDEYDAKDILDFWCTCGVLCSTATVTTASEPEKKPKAVRSAVVKPGRDEVAKRGLEDANVAFILREAEQRLGHILRQNEASTLVWLHDDLGLKASIILMIIGYAVEEGRANIGFIERTAVDWVNDGVLDIQSAENRLVELRRKNTAWHLVEQAFGIPHRQPTKAELEAADLWVTQWGYGHEIIKEAYEVCVDTISEFKISYIKKIIAEWQKAGVKTLDDIAKLNAKRTESKTKEKNSASNEYSDFVNGIIFDDDGEGNN